MNLRSSIGGGLLAALLVACSAANPPAPGAGLVATASPVDDQQSAGAPNLTATLAPEDPAASALQATATLVSGDPAAQPSAAAAEPMVGQSVSVGGPVTAILSPMLFEVDDTAHGGVLVLVPTGSFSVGQGQLVQASGVMQEFDVARLEQSLGMDIDDALGASVSGRPVVIADQIDATVAGP